MPLDVEMLKANQRSPMMQMASGNPADAEKLRAIIQMIMQGQNEPAAPMLPTPGGQQFQPMNTNPAPPGYRMNQMPGGGGGVDPRLLQALMARQASG